jgi:hypothetical protein
MAVIKLETFGGEVPMLQDRSIPAGSARIAQNLYPRTEDFIPLTDDRSIATTVPSGSISIYKLAHTSTGGDTSEDGGWLWQASTFLNYARGQVDDDFTERTYISYESGLTQPYAQNALNDSRPLGIAAPTVAPAVSISAVYQFSVDDAMAAIPLVKTQIADAMKSAFVVHADFGNAIPYVTPTSTTIGWLAHGTAVSVGVLPSTNGYQWNLCVPMVGGAVNPGFAYLLDPAFSGGQIVTGGVTYYAVPIRLMAPVYLPYGATMSTALAALKRPDKNSGGTYDDLFLSAEITSIVAASNAYWGWDAGSLGGPAKTAYDAAMVATKAVQLAIDNSAAPPVVVTTAYTSAKSTFYGATYAGAGASLKTILAWEATWFWDTDGAGAAAATHSRYWWPGQETTCFSNLTTDIDSCITTTNGVVFDAIKFRGLVRTDFLILINQANAVQKAIYMGEIEAALDESMAGFITFFSVANMKALGVGPASDDAKKQAVLTAISDANTALIKLQALDEELFRQRETAAENAYNLGPAARISAAAVTIITDSRYYVYTYLTDWGWESAPSPVSQLVEPDQNDKVWITCTLPPGGDHVLGVRLYRSVSGSSSSAFQLVYNLYGSTANVVTTTSGAFDYLDIIHTTGGFVAYEDAPPPALNAAILGEVCPTITWLTPPTLKKNGATAYLQGMTSGANGVMGGFIDNMVAFCEPYVPYAWPVEYQLTTKYTITGMGAFGQTFFIGTRANPYLASGSDSASMSLIEMPNPQACIAPRTIASTETGVLYVSPDGICMCDLSGVRVLTGALFTKKQWEAVYGATPATTMFAAVHDGVYYLSYTGGMYALDFVSGKLVEVTGTTPTAFHSDKITDTLYCVVGTAIKAMFGASTKRTAVYKTGVITLPKQEPIAWLQVFSDFASTVTVKWYGDGVLRQTHTPTTTAPLRLPAGRYLEHQIEITSAATITSVVFAGSTQELQSV